VASNNGKAIKATARAFKRLRPANGYNQKMYMELMSLLYALLSKIRREGMLAVENDVDNPEDSDLFNQFPTIAKDAMIMAFITDYIRLMVGGSMDALELDELMLHEIEVFEHESLVPAEALMKVGDAMPAFGIVAAVMGVVKALSVADAGPEEMGQMIAHALVGTFLGILIGYGFINPLASRLERQSSEAVKILQCIRVTLLASLHGYAPQIAVEFGRKALFSAERPSFVELEDHVRERRVA
jgi:chemotaxis protein MotA